MVKTRSMAVQYNKSAIITGQEASVSDGACPETSRVIVLEQKIHGLTTSVQLLMEQNQEIMQELRGRRGTTGDYDMRWLGPHVP